MFLNEVRLNVAQELKTKTKENHILLEKAILPKLNSIQTSVDYAKLLACFYGYFRPMETIIEKYITPEQLPDIKHGRKAFFILNDLASLSYSFQSLPLCDAIPAVSNQAMAFGALYVLECSTLGGKNIIHLLLQNKQVHINETSLSFSNGYGEDTGLMWLQFQQSLQQTICEKQFTETINTANETFKLFEQWIRKILH